MTVPSTDSIVRGELSQRSNPLATDRHKLHKVSESPGFTICATGTPSIPSRYLTIISSNGEKPGFRQTAKRFQYDTNFTPGPGQYQTTQTIDKQLERTSDSKRGSGGFASKTQRGSSWNTVTSAPAPTAYNLPTNFGLINRDANRSHCSSMFRKPIAERPTSTKSMYPAPNQYDISSGFMRTAKANNVAANAAFRSSSKRAAESHKKFVTPAPGTYDVDDLITRAAPSQHQSIFKSTSKRDAFNSEAASKLPGPADYRPFEKSNEEVHRQILPRRHYLTISAPAIPPAPEAPFPGPGAYELRDFKDAEKKYMSTAVFVSNTSRWNIDTTVGTQIPGPASYSPYVLPSKQSFNFNFERKWI